MKALSILAGALALLLAIDEPAQARARLGVHRARLHMPRGHQLRVPRPPFRTVRLRRADGTVMTGYRDSSGTHLRGPDGSIVHCQRQVGVAGIDVACR